MNAIATNSAISSNELTKSAGRSALFLFAGGATQTLIKIAASTVLARLLMPSDFGLLGMAVLVSTLITNIGALGMNVGIIAKSNITERDLSTAFWIMALVRLLMFATAFTSAPLAYLFFKDERVIQVIKAISITFLFQIPGQIPNTILRKQLRFSRLFIADVTSTLLESLVAIFLTMHFMHNYWALVIALISSTLCNNVLLFLFSRWRPKMIFDKESFRFLFRYGINSLGASVAEYFNNNIDYLLVGNLLGAKSLGLYEFAYRIPHLMVARMAGPLRLIMFPTLSLVSNSNSKMLSGYLKGVRFICFFTLPSLGGLAVLANIAVPLLWGDKWLPIIIPLQILCVSAAFQSLGGATRIIFILKGRPDIPFKFNVAFLSFTIALVALLGYFYGIMGVALGMALSTLPNIPSI